MRLDELDTPFIAVDLESFAENVQRAFERLAHVAVRPHQKTAGSPDVAAWLTRAGAAGICVATLGEAETMLAGGLDDILITSELAGRVKARRFADAVRSWPDARLRIVVDSFAGAAAVDAVLDRPVEALLDVNVAQNRCGVAPHEAVPLADRLAALANLRLVGVQGYEGNLQHVRDPADRRAQCDAAMARLATGVAALRERRHHVEIVTTGGTGTAEFCAAHDVVTEVQPGSFIFMDADYGDTTGVDYASAALVHATVISRPTPDRAVLDAGLKALSVDSGPARPCPANGWTYAHAGDEHGILTPTGPGAARLAVGDRVTLIPSHIDTTVNLYGALHAHRDGRVEHVWPVR